VRQGCDPIRGTPTGMPPQYPPLKIGPNSIVDIPKDGNFFFAEPINTIKNLIKNSLSDSDVNTYEIAIRAVSTFMFEIDERDGFENLDFNKRLFRLNKTTLNNFTKEFNIFKINVFSLESN
jgi:hypothetical protein